MYYKELLDLGFKRNDIFANDNAFFNQYGYNCYWLEYTLFRLGNSDSEKVHILIEWKPWENKFEMVTYIKDDVESRKEITKDEMELLIKINKRTGDLPKDNNYQYYTAC